MPLSIKQQRELDELIENRKKKLAAKVRAEQEATAAALELTAFLKEHGWESAKSTDGDTAMLAQFVNWQHLNTALVEADFPRAEYPSIYVPNYKELKEAANARHGVKNPSSTAAVSKYTGFVERLVIRPKRKMNTRTRRRTQ